MNFKTTITAFYHHYIMAKFREHRRTFQFSSQGAPRHLPFNNDTIHYMHINFQTLDVLDTKVCMHC